MAPFVFLLFLQSAAASEVISVKSGDDVTLSCRADGGSITTVEWTRTDLKSEYVHFHRDGRSDPANQHPSFEDRVQLVDSELKDGDVSLILKKVTMNDTGTYECRVATGGSKLQKDPIRSFRLEVTDSSSFRLEVTDSGGDHGWIAAGVVVLVLVVAGVVVVFVWRSKRRREL